MKELFFYVLVAALCAWGTVWLILQGDAKWEISDKWFLPDVIDLIHGYGFSVKRVAFYAIFVIYLVTSFHRPLARFLFNVVIWIIIIIIGIVVCGILYSLVLWLAGTL